MIDWVPLSTNARLDELERLQGSPVFAHLRGRPRFALVELFEIARVIAGTVVAAGGEPATGPMMVLEGAAEVEGPEKRRVEAGDWMALGSLGHDLPVHPAQITALTSMILVRLERSRFDALVARSPALAVELVRGAIDTLGGKPPRRAPTPNREVASLVPSTIDGVLVVGARAQGRTLSLDAQAPPDLPLTPLTLRDWEGREIYKRSVGLVTLEAARLEGLTGTRLGPSWSSGRLVVLPTSEPISGDGIRRLNERLAALIERRVALHEETWDADDAADHFRGLGLGDVADLVLSTSDPRVALVACGETRVPSPGPVLPHAGAISGALVHPHPDGLALDFGPLVRGQLAPRPAKTLLVEARSPRYGAEMTKEERAWLQLLNVDSVGSFNRAVVSGEVSEVIRVCEGFHEKRLGRLADEIRDRKTVRIVVVAGPSSSGKTTFIKRLRVQLEADGISPVGVSLDDYYVDREKTPRDASGEYDFEALAALDRQLLGEQLQALLAGRSIRGARFDFVSGKSLPDGGRTLELPERSVLVLEGLHALNPELLAGLDPAVVHRIFIHPATSIPFDPLTTLEPADVRLIRRIVRDRHTRGATAEDNLARWASVRRGERLNVFPFQAVAESIFDTSLLYEPSVLKVFAERYLLEVPRASPHYPAALRLRRLLAPFVTIYPDHVPATSILREFIGKQSVDW